MAKRKRQPQASAELPSVPDSLPVPGEKSLANAHGGNAIDQGASESKRKKAMLNWELWFGAILVICAIVQASVGYWQWRTMARNTAQTDETIRLMRQEQRPWLTVREAVLKRPKCRLWLRNSGSLPARLIRVESGACVIDSNEDFNNWYKSNDRDVTSISVDTSIPPGVATFLEPEVADILEPDEWAAVSSGKAHFYFYGKLNYESVFDEKYETEFCLVYEPNSDTMYTYSLFNRSE